MRFYIIRHGETEANKEGLLQGTLDTPLTEYGIELAQITGKGLKDVKFDACFSSPLKRAVDTAKTILKENQNEVPEIILDKRIQEVAMGTWEGKHIKGKELDIDPALLTTFMTNPFILKEFPEGEKVIDVCNRTQEFLIDIAKHNNYENVLVSTHGFALRAMLNSLYENKNDFWQGHVPYNCCLNIVEWNGQKLELVEKDKVLYDKNMIVDRYKL